MMKRFIVPGIIVLACAALGGLGWWYWFARPSGQVAYRTAEVKRADIVAAISATGTVVPEDVVDVGTQVNGMIASFGTDADGKTVDFRSTVTEGMVLARIDDTLYAATEASVEASLAQAQAQVALNQTNVAAAQAKLDQAQKDWARAQKLGPSRSLSQADYDAAESAWQQAVAGLEQAKASVTLAQATASSVAATLKGAKQNLVYCTIKSPVNGVIIDRRVDIGQTVVSSLSAPSLFLIAKDLSKMQVLVQVNEADIGHVKPGDAVTFTADAFPGDTFKGQVRKVRLNATQTQNVVTYTVEIVTDNSSLKLLPYLTANVQFVVGQREQVLAVPNAALRWSPKNAGYGGASSPQSQGPKPDPDSSADRRAESSTLWVLGNTGLRPVKVRAGLSDGTLTEVSSPDLQEGDQIVISEATPGTPGATVASPFAPQMAGKRR
jgi:HlyD family secretion protein